MSRSVKNTGTRRHMGWFHGDAGTRLSASAPAFDGVCASPMTCLQRIQSRSHLLELAYDVTLRLLNPVRRWAKPAGTMERTFVLGERITKGILFNCQMCGQCILHSTGMTCPMTCPKNLRNGPCGGVRANGHCEIKPEMSCVWVQAWNRSKKMPSHGRQIMEIQPPLDCRLAGSSAWINDLTGRSHRAPAGWPE